MGQHQVRPMAIAPISSLSLPSVEDVIWQNGSGVSITGNTLKKITASMLWDSGAESQQRILSGDCAVEMTVADDFSNCVIGFSSTNPDNGFSTIAHLVGTDGSNADYELKKYQFKSLPSTFVTYKGHLKIGDTLKISIEGLSVCFYVNGVKMGSNTPTAGIGYPLLIDSSIQTPNGTISKARLIKGSGFTSHTPIKGKGMERSGYRLIQFQEFTKHFYNFEYSGLVWSQTGLSVSIRPLSSTSLIEVIADITGFGVTGMDTGFHGILAIFKNGILWKPLCISHLSPTISETFQSVSKQWIDEEAKSATYDLRVRCLDFSSSTSGGKLILKSVIVGSTDDPSSSAPSDGQEEDEFFGECSLTAKEWYQN